MSERQSSVLCAALSVSVICNMYLVCAALKLVILTFEIDPNSSYLPGTSCPVRDLRLRIR